MVPSAPPVPFVLGGQASKADVEDPVPESATHSPFSFKISTIRAPLYRALRPRFGVNGHSRLAETLPLLHIPDIGTYRKLLLSAPGGHPMRAVPARVPPWLRSIHRALEPRSVHTSKGGAAGLERASAAALARTAPSGRTVPVAAPAVLAASPRLLARSGTECNRWNNSPFHLPSSPRT